MSLGGVGRNIAHNMSPAGHGRPAADRLRRRHLRPEDRRQLRRTGHRHLPVPDRFPAGRTSTYLFITDERGDMALAVSDMEIYKHMTPQTALASG